MIFNGFLLLAFALPIGVANRKLSHELNMINVNARGLYLHFYHFTDQMFQRFFFFYLLIVFSKPIYQTFTSAIPMEEKLEFEIKYVRHSVAI